MCVLDRHNISYELYNHYIVINKLWCCILWKIFLTFCRLRFRLHSSEMIQIRIYGMLEDHSDQGASKVLMNLWDLAVPLMHKRMRTTLDHESFYRSSQRNHCTLCWRMRPLHSFIIQLELYLNRTTLQNLDATLFQYYIYLICAIYQIYWISEQSA